MRIGSLPSRPNFMTSSETSFGDYQAGSPCSSIGLTGLPDIPQRILRLPRCAESTCQANVSGINQVAMSSRTTACPFLIDFAYFPRGSFQNPQIRHPWKFLPKFLIQVWGDLGCSLNRQLLHRRNRCELEYSISSHGTAPDSKTMNRRKLGDGACRCIRKIAL